ncbi:hypothetical protein jhhlp_007146 [Lomentospora prolificans]|uniref:Uncharacterized protein n=1 Tax=Lomentospora prolificans TaxID=41688 RepID=A0A2N3N1U0_9PEZI|nr:hypothetical protein jhhlp_007146 [Lomentospora prolificans]
MPPQGPIFPIPVYEDSGGDSDSVSHGSNAADNMYDDDDNATTPNHAPYAAQIPSHYTTQTMSTPGYPFLSYSQEYVAAHDSTDDDDDDEDGDIDMSDSEGGVPLDHTEGPQIFTSYNHQAPPHNTWSTTSAPDIVTLDPYHPHATIPSYNQYVAAISTIQTPTFPPPSVSHMIPGPGGPSLTPPHIPHANAAPSSAFPLSQFSNYEIPESITYNPAPPPPNDDPASQSPIPIPGQPHMAQMDEDTEESEGPHPPTTSFHANPGNQGPQTPGILGPPNLGLLPFLRIWGQTRLYVPDDRRPRFRAPWPPHVDELETSRVKSIEYDDLAGDQCDVQGIDWAHLGVSRKEARERRLNTYTNFVNIEGSDAFNTDRSDRMLQRSENYFRFRKMDIRKNVRLNHFQLRNILASSSRTRSYYPEARGIRQINPLTGRDELFLDLKDMDGGGLVSTLSATDRVLVAGTFNGEYCIKNLDSSEKRHVEGQLTDDTSGITTHVQVYESRNSSSPHAAFASNDRGFRILDVATQKFVLQTMYNFPVNCTVLSPDKRLRVMVGDHYTAVVTNAETGEVLQELKGHLDFGFSCDWADDGWTVATGSQDMTVKIWDARRWSNANGENTPVCTIRSEMAGVRNLKFSPLGSGKRVLVATEEADFVNVIDARDFWRKQTFDVFGEIGGITFANDGQDLQVLCCDAARGGLLQLERCNLGAETAEVGYDPNFARFRSWKQERDGFDWAPSVEEVVRDARANGTVARRRRRAAMVEPLVPF